jgi:hypothetical protein
MTAEPCRDEDGVMAFYSEQSLALLSGVAGVSVDGRN